MNEVKPGIKTTEFYMTLVTQIMGLLAVLGVISPEQAQTLTWGGGVVGAEAVTESMNSVTTIIPQVTGLIVMLGSAFGYTHNRAKIKSKEEK